jgi:hypothetical protein
VGYGDAAVGGAPWLGFGCQTNSEELPTMRDKIDLAGIMETLEKTLADCERSLQSSDDWRMHVHLHVTCHPRDGNGGMISFTVGTEWPDDEDECSSHGGDRE